MALAPLNLRLIEARTQITNVLAKNAGSIASGVEASFAGAFTSGIVTAIEKGAAWVEKAGGVKAAFSKLGSLMAGPFGVGLITALGGVIVKEMERSSLEQIDRIDAFAENSVRLVKRMRSEFEAIQSGENLAAVTTRAGNEFNRVDSEIAKRANANPSEENTAALKALKFERQELLALISIIREKGLVTLEANLADKQSRDEAAAGYARLTHMEQTIRNVRMRSDLSPEEKRRTILDALTVSAETVAAKIERAQAALAKLGKSDEEIAKILSVDPEYLRLVEQLEVLRIEGTNLKFPSSDFRAINDEYRAFSRGERMNGGRRLTTGQGVEAGAMQWGMSLGTQGEQVAQAIQGSIGATVSGISDGIHGWITGVSNFGDMVRNIGSSVLKVFLDTIVQMGVQWVINGVLGKATIASLSLTGMAARKAETADVVANEGVKAGPLMANAAASSISSWGIAAAIGVAALIAAMAAFGGFVEGGYTGDGDKYALAGVVHRGEVVWSQADVRRAGGVASVEAARLGGLNRLATMPASVLPAPASYAPAPLAPPVMQSLAEGGGAGGRSGKGGDRYIVIDKPTLKQIMHDDPTAETYFAEMMYRHRGNLFS